MTKAKPKTAWEVGEKYAEIRIAIRALEEIANMRAEDNFKSWKDKVDGIDTWQEEFFNKVIIDPINKHAQKALEDIYKIQKRKATLYEIPYLNYDH